MTETLKDGDSWAPTSLGLSQAEKVRRDFPILTDGLAYLDNAATTHKPLSVIQRINRFYSSENSNVHRGVYKLSEMATAAYEDARQKIAAYLGDVPPQEVIFTRGSTEAINLVAASWCPIFLNEGDEILVTIAEHHSNIVPWQLAAERAKAKVVFAPLNADYRLDMKAFRERLSPRTKIVAMAHVSNVLGVVHPVEEMIALAKKVGAITVVDGAQAIPHMRVDLKALDCDFYCFSGHKALGPTGIGVLYGKSRWLEAMLPYQGGGGMICMVTVQGSTWAPAPEKFEAGTPNIEGAIGLGAAIAYLSELPLKELAVHQRQLGEMVYERLRAMKGVRLFAAPGSDWTGIVSFYHQAIHPHDLAAVADSVGVCIRAGHHCAQPLMRVLGVGSTARVSPYIYNTPNDIALFGEAMTKAEAIFG